MILTGLSLLEQQSHGHINEKIKKKNAMHSSECVFVNPASKTHCLFSAHNWTRQ